MTSLWIQAHGLQLRAMTKGVGEALGKILGEVLEVKSDYDGAAIGWCVHIRAQVNVKKPLCQWASINIEGASSRTIFRYEKIADFCFYCGRLNHQDKDCQSIPPNGKKYYGPWMRPNGQNPITLTEIAAELNRLNSKIPDLPLNQSPRTLTS